MGCTTQTATLFLLAVDKEKLQQRLNRERKQKQQESAAFRGKEANLNREQKQKQQKSAAFTGKEANKMAAKQQDSVFRELESTKKAAKRLDPAFREDEVEYVEFTHYPKPPREQRRRFDSCLRSFQLLLTFHLHF